MKKGVSLTSKDIAGQTKKTRSTPSGVCSIERVHVRGGLPVIDYALIKNSILGNSYSLTIFFTDEKISEELHVKFKHKPGPANILSFPYSTELGEIYLHWPTVKQKATEFEHSPKEHLVYLVIHGCLHLLGYTHGAQMDSLERYWMSILLDKALSRNIV